MVRQAISVGALLLLLGLPGGPAGAQAGTIPIDDSYTVSSRFQSNRAEHPDFRLPVLSMVDGQRIQFDRLYKTVGERELHADLFLPPPEANLRQAIVLVHGGGWRSGNKSNFYAIANLLAQRGYAVVLPEFRLAPEAGYPAGLLDVNDAIEWTIAQADELGIDPHRIAIGGESAGGQMASLLAYTGGSPLFANGPDGAPRVNALIDIDGVLDFTTPLALQNENRPQSVAAQWLGGSFEQDPERWREASAASHVAAASPPTLIISGEAPRFTAGRETVLGELARHKVAARHLHFPGQPHAFWLFEPYAGQVVEAIDAFLRGIEAPERADP